MENAMEDSINDARAVKLGQLKILVAVAEHGSFSAAAAALDCTQSRISHAIAALEKTLGARLLTRSHNGTVPTDIGQRALAQARQMLVLERGLLALATDGGASAGHVRIACFRSVGTHLLPHALEALARDYPGIQVDIDDGCAERDDVTQAVRQGRADIGIAHLPAGDDFIARPWLHDAYVFVAPAGLAITAPASWRQFDALPLIELDCSGAAAILARCRGAGLRAEAVRRLANDSSILALVGRGMGYSILPRLAAFPAPHEVRLFDLPLETKRHLALIALPNTMRSKAVQIVARYLCDKRIVAKTKAFQSGIVSLD